MNEDAVFKLGKVTESDLSMTFNDELY